MFSQPIKSQDRHRDRSLDRGQRLSSAQGPFGSPAPVRVSFSNSRFPSPGPAFDFEQAAKSACRAANLGHLKRHVFEDDLLILSQHAGIAPDRMNLMLGLDMTVDSGSAEHIEHTIGLVPGWLDVRRDKWDDALTESVRAQIDAHNASEEHSLAADFAESKAGPEGSDSTGAEQASKTETTAMKSPAETSDGAEAASSAPDPLDALVWLNERLNQAPRGTRSQIARAMERSPNDLSAWLNGLRPLPSYARGALVRAVSQVDAALGESLKARLDAQPHGSAIIEAAVRKAGTPAQAKALMPEPPPASARKDAHAKDSSASPSFAGVDAEKPTEEIKGRTALPPKNTTEEDSGAGAQIDLQSQHPAQLLARRAGDVMPAAASAAQKTQPPLRRQSDSPTQSAQETPAAVSEIDAIAMKTASILAEVMGYIVRRAGRRS